MDKLIEYLNRYNINNACTLGHIEPGQVSMAFVASPIYIVRAGSNRIYRFNSARSTNHFVGSSSNERFPGTNTSSYTQKLRNFEKRKNKVVAKTMTNKNMLYCMN